MHLTTLTDFKDETTQKNELFENLKHLKFNDLFDLDDNVPDHILLKICEFGVVEWGLFSLLAVNLFFLILVDFCTESQSDNVNTRRLPAFKIQETL